jgi:hypothetical protein
VRCPSAWTAQPHLWRVASSFGLGGCGLASQSTELSLEHPKLKKFIVAARASSALEIHFGLFLLTCVYNIVLDRVCS